MLNRYGGTPRTIAFYDMFPYKRSEEDRKTKREYEDFIKFTQSVLLHNFMCGNCSFNHKTVEFYLTSDIYTAKCDNCSRKMVAKIRHLVWSQIMWLI